MNDKLFIFAMIVAGLAVISVGIAFVRDFLSLPNAQKLKNIQEWMLYAVTEAEKTLGSGTGQIKLRMVYDMFINQFPEVAKWITFDTVAKMVDIALDKFRVLLEQNDSLKDYVYGKGKVE